MKPTRGGVSAVSRSGGWTFRLGGAAVAALAVCGCWQPVAERGANVGEGADAGLVEAEAQDGGALDAGSSPAEDAGPDVHLPVPLRAVAALSRTDVWAFGVGAIFHFDGARWRDVTPQGAAQVCWTDAEASEGTVWAVGETASATVLFDSRRKTVRPLSWSSGRVEQPRLLKARAAELYVGGAARDAGVLVRSTDDGESWSAEDLAPCARVIAGNVVPYALPGGRLVWDGPPIAFTQEGAVMVYVDGPSGRGWSQSGSVSRGLPVTEAVHFEVDEQGYVVAWFATPGAFRRWGGDLGPQPMTWPAPGASALTVRAMWAPSRLEQWAVGDDGAVVRFDGQLWGLQPAPSTERLVDVHGADGWVWVVGEQGAVYHLTP